MIKRTLLAVVGATVAMNLGASALAAPKDATTWQLSTSSTTSVTVVQHDNLGGMGAPRSHDTRAEVVIYQIEGIGNFHQVHIQTGF